MLRAWPGGSGGEDIICTNVTLFHRGPINHSPGDGDEDSCQYTHRPPLPLPHTTVNSPVNWTIIIITRCVTPTLLAGLRYIGGVPGFLRCHPPSPAPPWHGEELGHTKSTASYRFRGWGQTSFRLDHLQSQLSKNWVISSVMPCPSNVKIIIVQSALDSSPMC